MDKRYLQLYSLSKYMTEDFDGSLAKVKDIGYTGVEFAGGFYGGHGVVEMKNILDALGLDPLSSHIMLDAIPGHLDYASELGLRFLVVPMAVISTYEEAAGFAKKLNDTGRLCSSREIKLGYHNHRHEFLEGKDGYLLETMIKETDPDHVFFQLDAGWAACGGVNVPEFIRKHAGRFPLIHVKECSTVVGPEKMTDFSQFPKDEKGMPVLPPEVRQKLSEENKWNAPCGKGIIDWPAVRDAALDQGARAFIIEREYAYNGDIFACVKEDCEYLKSL